MTDTPLISVVMPVYNGERFLTEAIDSILNQTFRDFEFIIIDDGSTDNTPVILEQYSKKDKRIIWYREDKNEGIIVALNTGLNLARGKYIARMDADDISLPERLERQVRYLESNKEVGVLGSGAQIIDQYGRTSSIIKFPETNSPILWSLSYFCPIIHPTVMARREIYVEAGGYRSVWPHAEDYDLWTRIAGRSTLHNLGEVLLQLRKHEANITQAEFPLTLSNSLEISRKFVETLLGKNLSPDLIKVLWNIDEPRNLMNAPELLSQIYERFLERYKINAEEKAFLRKDVAMRLTHMANRHFRDSRSLAVLMQAFRYHPLMPVIALGRSISYKIKNMQR